MRTLITILTVLAVAPHWIEGDSKCSIGSRVVYCAGRHAVFANIAGKILRVDSLTGRTLWVTTEQDDIDAGPVIADETVAYLASGGSRLQGLDESDGSIRWSRPVRKSLSMIAASDVIVLQTPDREGVFGVDPKDGRTLWQRETPGGTPAFVKMLGIDADRVLTNLFCLRPSDGTICARWPLVASDLATEGSARILAKEDGSLFALGSDGLAAWPPAVVRALAGGGSDQLVGVVPLGHVVAIVVANRARREIEVRAISVAGAIQWRRSFPGGELLNGPLAAANQRMVLQVPGADHGSWSLVALDADGRDIWTRTTRWHFWPVGKLACDQQTCFGVAAIEASTERLAQLDLTQGQVLELGHSETGLPDRHLWN